MQCQSACFDDLNIPVEQCKRSVERLQFSFLTMWWCHQWLQLKYIFIGTYKDSPIAGLQYLLEYYMVILFVKTQFLIWIPDSEQARIWTQISRPKVAVRDSSAKRDHATIVLLHSTDKRPTTFKMLLNYVLNLNINLYNQNKNLWLRLWSLKMKSVFIMIAQYGVRNNTSVPSLFFLSSLLGIFAAIRHGSIVPVRHFVNILSYFWAFNHN